jgi:hypothetical protein
LPLQNLWQTGIQDRLFGTMLSICGGRSSIG